MAKDNSIKSQRDMFLAFSFASSDLLLEIKADDTIGFALGAGKSLTGVDHTSLMGRKWLDLFDKKEKISLITLRNEAMPGKRCGPSHVKLNPDISDKDAIVTGIKMPGSDSFYMTASFVTDVMAKLAGLDKKIEREAPKDKEGFIDATKDALDDAREQGIEVDLTLLDLASSTTIKEQMGADMWDTFTDAVQDILTANSVDGYTASEITEGRYGIVHDKDVTSESIKEQLSEMAKETAPDTEGIEFESKTLPAEVATLSEQEAARAIVYTINEFEREGTQLSIDTLGSGLKRFATENAQKIKTFKTMIKQLNFQIFFQPIVDLSTYELSHFEMLSRFKNEGSTAEWIMFGEDIGMAAEMDMAICERAINFLKFKAASNNFVFSLNLSGQSIQNETFFDALYNKLSMHKNMASRLIFEITESNEMLDVMKINKFVTALQNDGFKVCLDDFGAGSADFNYLQQIHVDYIKIDGKYTKKILSSDRDQVMIKNLSKMCRDLNTKVISERIEYDEQAQLMKDLGVHLGQGYYFAEPKPNPEYVALSTSSKASQNS